MALTVSYTGQLSEATGVTEEAVQIAGGERLAGLIATLGEKHGEKFSELLLDDSGNLRSTVLVVLDGSQATGDLDSILLDDVQDLMLMTPIAGG